MFTKNHPVVKILMKRDEISAYEAIEWCEICHERLMEAVDGSGEDPQDIIQEELGLEPDYLFDLI